MPYSGEADAANILLVLFLLVGQAEHCSDSLAGPIPAISPIASPSGKVCPMKICCTFRVKREFVAEKARSDPN